MIVVVHLNQCDKIMGVLKCCWFSVTVLFQLLTGAYVLL